jgi:hypothetical protein
MSVINRLAPGAERQRLPEFRPRPALCRSAVTTVPCGGDAAISRAASSMVEVVVCKR